MYLFKWNKHREEYYYYYHHISVKLLGRKTETFHADQSFEMSMNIICVYDLLKHVKNISNQ